ncbi:MAG TPA: GspE/PulE family protein [Patescibacteria group bacterium]|nr:GspE/PulE family protein [Patescibacteria group bacterium]
MQLTPQQLETVFVKSGLLSEADFETAKKHSVDKKTPLQNILVEENFISDEHLGELLADYFGWKFVNLRKQEIVKDVLKIIPEAVARKQSIVCFKRDLVGLHAAMADPENAEIVSFLEKKTGLPVTAYYATERDIENTLSKYKAEVKEDFQTILQANIESLAGMSPEQVERQGKDLPVIRMMDALLDYAYDSRASDIHIEPQSGRTIVRFRIDGILHDIIDFPVSIHDLLITRLKILSRLRTDEHRAPQDGKLQKQIGKEKLDVRVSIVPVTEGEKVVMRLLSERSREYSLEDLGITDQDLALVKASIKRPFGMTIVCGPTGSGKTTSLYAMIKIINTREINISTVEDPVEYHLAGINQIQVNPKVGLTFAAGLRSLLRQDPNVVLVGEIRDAETAKIAVNAAMTGQLVLTTLHTTNAAMALPRLLDMEVEPFLVSSTIHLVMAQRLVRKIHPGCIVSYSVTPEEVANIKEQLGEEHAKAVGLDRAGLRLYRGAGCKVCKNTGYEGRLGIFEILEMKENIRKAIMKHMTADELEQIAIKENGMRTMLEDGIAKALNGLTTIEEVLRVRGE